MYLSPKKHILSEAMLITAVIRLGMAAFGATVRLIVRKGGILPDMTDRMTYGLQNLFSLFTVLLSCAVFVRALVYLTRNIALVPEEERREIALLQEEYFGKNNAALPAETVRKLLEIWFVILVGAQMMYDFMAVIYRRFATRLAEIVLLSGSEDAQSAYVSLYNFTHGFKYQGMLIALLLGAMMTAIFLSDKALFAAATAIAFLFLACSMGMEMYTLTFMGRSYGVVWTSVLFHFIETVGLIALALYLRVRYNGV